MRRWRIGREAGLRRLTREDLVRFYRNFYRPSSTILSIVGDLDVGETLRHVERLYGALEAAPVERNPGPEETGADRFRYRELAGDIAQSEQVFGWRTQPTLHDDTPLLDLAAGVLGAGRASRLYRAVRERQLAASVSAYNYTPTDVGVFVVHADMPAATAVPAAAAIWDQVRALREGGVLPQELVRAQRMFESRWLRHLESMEGQATHLAEWEALGDWRLGDRYFERTTTATAPEVTAVVQRYLTPERAGWVMYRPTAADPVADDPDAALTLLTSVAAPVLAPGPEVPEAPVPPATPRLTLEREEGGIRVYRTSRGLPVLVRSRPGAPIVHIGVYARGGAGVEPQALGGLTTLLVRTSLKGTERRSATAIAEESELLGAVMGTSVTADGMGWTISAPVTRVVPVIDMLADVVQRATFLDDALETERDRCAGERRAAAGRHVPASGAARDAGCVRHASVRAFRDRVGGDVRRDRRDRRSRVAS
jgi:zinc protease